MNGYWAKYSFEECKFVKIEGDAMHIVETYIYSNASENLEKQVEVELKKEDPKVEDATASLDVYKLIKKIDSEE